MIKKPETTRNQTSLISLASCLRIAAALFALASSQPASSQTPAPNPNFEILSGATLDASTGIWTTTAGTQVTFLALDEGAYSEFQWSFSDGGLLAGRAVTYVFTQGGTAKVILYTTITDGTTTYTLGSYQLINVLSESFDPTITTVVPPPVAVVDEPRPSVTPLNQVGNPSPLGPSQSDLDTQDTLDARVQLYLLRHGDDGVIDPQNYLNLVAQSYLDSIDSLCICGRGGWTSIGPSNGSGRLRAIVPHPTISTTVLVGAADGGVWRTTDGGASWTSMTDCIHDLAVGALAVAPSNPSIIYVGTGEPSASDGVPGYGFVTSTDGGGCWSFPATVVASSFYALSVNPTNPSDILAGVIPTQGNTNGGMRSLDGGNTWTTVITTSAYGYLTSIARDPSNSNTVYGGTWNPGTGVMKALKSLDGGTTWTPIVTGLPSPGPTQYFFRLTIAISPSNPSILYASTAVKDTSTGIFTSMIFKTTNSGSSWSALSLGGYSNYLGAYPGYTNALVVSPTDPNVIIAGGVTNIRTTNGGGSWSQAFATSNIHLDTHDLRYNGSTLLIANDGGYWTSPDNGVSATEHDTGLVARQFYSLVSDWSNLNRIFGGTQDNGTNRRRDTGGSLWDIVLYGDGSDSAINYNDPSIAYATYQYGQIWRTFTANLGASSGFSNDTPPYPSGETGPFSTVLTMDPVTPSTLYTGSYRVWRSADGGDSWQPLTAFSGTSTSITAIAVSKSNPAVILASNGPDIYRSANGGSSWSRVTGSLPTNCTGLEIDPTNASVAYVTFPGTTGNRVWYTTNGGQSWAPRASGLPQFSAQAIRVDPGNSNNLFCGTDIGLYRSTDQGASWHTETAPLPNSSVQAVNIFPDRTKLRVGTHGRGAWEETYIASTNHPPTVTISSPGSTSITRGMSLTFTGSATDPDTGDSVTGVWYFPDVWQGVATSGGPTTTTHQFNKNGAWPIALTAADNHGARSSTFVTITVHN
jgi:photosystem II stability/assembly factor-like uncharacterized protein